MATYNFTIRATDTAGAFADRAFSINVNNTTLDRFVVVGSAGLARSVNGTSWTYEPGRSGSGVTYGNGKWVVWNGANFTMHSSPDGVNWTTTTLTTTTGSTGSFNLLGVKVGTQGLSSVKYVNGRWIAFGYSNNNVQTTAAMQCWESADLTTWTLRGDIANNQAAQSSYRAGITDVTYGNGLYIATGGYAHSASAFTKAIYTSPDLITWTSRQSTVGTAASSGGASILNINGLFITTLFTSGSTSLYTSPDGTTWTNRTTGTGTYAWGLQYVNGRIYTVMGGALFRSTDAGQTWATTTYAPTPNIDQSAAGTPDLIGSNLMAAYGGTIITACTKASATSDIHRINSDASSAFTVQTLTAGSVGTVRAVAARQ